MSSGKHRVGVNWVARVTATLLFAIGIALIVAAILTTPAPEGPPMSRTARVFTAVAVTLGASIALAGTAAADVTTTPTQSCTTNVVCIPVNAPIDAHNLLNLTNSLNGGLLSGLL